MSPTHTGATPDDDGARDGSGAPTRNDSPGKGEPDPEGVLPETTDENDDPVENPSG